MTDDDTTFRRLIEQIPDYAIFLMDPNGLATSWNEGVEHVLGYAEAEFIGIDARELFTPEDRAAAVPERELAEAARNGSASDDRWMRHKDGHRFWAVGRTAIVRDEAGRMVGYARVLRDRSDLKQAEERLHRVEARYRILAEAASDAIITIDPASTITFANPAVEQIFGYAPDELVGRSLTLLMPQYLRHLHQAGMDRYLGTGTRHLDWRAVEVPGLHREGHELPLEVSFGESHAGGDHTFTGIIRDISERKRAEGALRASVERYRALVSATTSVVWITDRDGRLLEPQPTWEAYTGQPWEAHREFGWMAMVHPEDREVIAAAWKEAVATRRAYEARGRLWNAPRGKYRHFAVRAIPVLGPEGRVHEWVGAIVDVEEQWQAEQRLRNAERLQAVGTLAGGVAHEVNNQMTGVLGFGALVLKALGPGHPQAADMRLVLESAERAARISQQLLAFTRQQLTRPRELDLHALARELHPVLQQLLGADKRLIVRGAAPTRSIHADPGQVQQVLINLVANARDASETDSEVVIAVDEVAVDSTSATVEGVAMRPGQYGRLTVADQGHGMDADTRARIFEPFFTTKPVGAGTGLGLSMVYGIVKQHGGYVWARSAPGVGTTLELYWPVATLKDATRDLSPEPDQSSAAPASLVRDGMVLVAEDEPLVRLLAARTLEAEGYRVVSAVDGKAALELLDGDTVRPDLLITDLIMPRLNGRQLSDAVAARWPGLPVLFISGHTGGDATLERLIPPGAPFLQKPFTPEALARLVGNLIAKTAGAG